VTPLVAFSAAAFIMTLLGGIVPFVRSSLSRESLLRMFSLRSGILLSAAFIGVLPEAWAMQRTTAGWGALGGFAFLFFMGNFSMLDCCPEYIEQCSVHMIGASALAALSLHSFIDGLNLSVAFSAGKAVGAAIGLALSLHKIADGFTLTSLLAQAGYRRMTSLTALCVIAAATPLGSLLSAFGLAQLSIEAQAALLGFSGGTFLYIGASDLLPRLHKAEDKSHLLYFCAGLFSMWALKLAP